MAAVLSTRPGAAARRRRGARGSTLAILMVVVAVMSIMVTVATEKWSRLVIREKEKDLIERGQRIQLALWYYARDNHGALPTKLEDLTKGPHHFLTQVPPDPMTARFDREGKLVAGTGKWVLLHPGDEVNPVPTPSRPGRRGGFGSGGFDSDSFGASGATGASGAQGDSGAPTGDSGASGGGTSQDGSRGRRQGRASGFGGDLPSVQPIRGVKSSSDDHSIGTFLDLPPDTPYSAWKFEVQSGGGATSLQQTAHVGFPVLTYPPGFSGLRAPGRPPVNRTGFAAGAPPGGTPPAGGRGGQAFPR